MDNQYTLIDARNLLCPMPVIRTQQAIEGIVASGKLKVVCSDPGVLHDIPAWARVHGHTLISASEVNDEYIVIIDVKK
jgi:tRNA 2-thiouridine synthesizing protein A